MAAGSTPEKRADVRKWSNAGVTLTGWRIPQDLIYMQRQLWAPAQGGVRALGSDSAGVEAGSWSCSISGCQMQQLGQAHEGTTGGIHLQVCEDPKICCVNTVP